MVAAEAGEAEEAQSAEAEQLMNLRMQEIFSAKGNKACADCPAKKRKFAAVIRPMVSAAALNSKWLFFFVVFSFSSLGIFLEESQKGGWRW